MFLTPHSQDITDSAVQCSTHTQYYAAQCSIVQHSGAQCSTHSTVQYTHAVLCSTVQRSTMQYTHAVQCSAVQHTQQCSTHMQYSAAHTVQCSTHMQYCAEHTHSTVQYTHTQYCAVHTCTMGKYAAITPTTSISTDEIEPLV